MLRPVPSADLPTRGRGHHEACPHADVDTLPHVQEFPDHPTVVGQKAHILHLMGRSDEGLALLATLRRGRVIPDHVQAVEAELLEAVGRGDEVDEIINALAASSTTSDFAMRRLVKIVQQRGQQERYEAMLDLWASRARDRRMALMVQAECLPNPRRVLATLLTEYPNDDDVLEKVTTLQIAGLPPDEAIEELQTLLSLQRGASHTRLRSRLGTMLRKSGRLEEAAEELEKCRLAEPESGFIACHLGYTYRDLGREEAAVPLFEQALDQSPGDSIIRRSLFALYRKLGLQERAHAFVVEFTSKHGQWKGPMWGDFRKLTTQKPAATSARKTTRGRASGSNSP